ncbi:ATP-binding protein [Agriterribacter sp.]|uniref:ATP-binding protein n=1 Tax=Agriterribacter sp. TaxID=2821509 RepID=UPI002BE5B6E6|nr:ATP-binding protein [Agriterribacter sp.]HRP57617.1 ATP-binding protein [Agriterribacter sp.]
MKKAWLIVLTAIVASWVVLFVLSASPLESTKPAQEGLLDLRSRDLSSANINLSGQWEFYWSQLLLPGEEMEQRSYARFPLLWNKIEVQGKPLPSLGYATYRLKVILPPATPLLALRIPDMYSSYRLYINDSLAVENGTPASGKEEAKPFWSERIVLLPQHTDTISLLMHVANFWHSKGGPHKPVVLGNFQQISRQSKIDWGLDTITTGFILMSSFLFFGLYLFAKNDKPILYFALFCLIYSYRMIGTGPYLFYSLFPGMDWFVTIRIEYLSLVLSCACLFQYIRHLYPQEAGKIVVRVLLWISAVYSIIILTTTVHFFSSVMPVYLVILFFYLAYAFYVFITAYIHKRNDSDFALLSACIAFILFLFLNLHYFKLAPVMKLMVCSGYILFLFLQAVILSSRFAYTLSYAALQAQLGVKAKSEFLSTMSHEIRTPLNAIIGLVHILLKGKPSSSQKETLEVVLFSANNLLVLVNDILNYSKLEENKMKLEKIDMDLQEIGKNIIRGAQSFADSKKIKLEYEFDDRIPGQVVGDPTRITQVITNLVHNAIKFTDEGWVKLSFYVEKIDEHQVMVTIAIKDSGIGILPGEQKIIFKRFTQADSSTSRKYGGTGLGLAISKRILSLYNVDLKFDSEPGSGSTFWFTLPFPVTTTKKDVTLSSAGSDKPLRNCFILIADDNALNVMIVRTILEDFGAAVDVAGNGKEALEKFDAAIHHIVLMDLNMPEMDGFEATRQLRNKGVTVPVIALTATLPAEIADNINAAGFTDIIVKPFDPDGLCRTVLKYRKKE